jgi:hypothetical protein
VSSATPALICQGLASVDPLTVLTDRLNDISGQTQNLRLPYTTKEAIEAAIDGIGESFATIGQ